MAVKLNRGEIRAAQHLFAPDETQALESVETTKRFVVASLLENVQGRLKHGGLPTANGRKSNCRACPQARWK